MLLIICTVISQAFEQDVVTSRVVSENRMAFQIGSACETYRNADGRVMSFVVIMLLKFWPHVPCIKFGSSERCQTSYSPVCLPFGVHGEISFAPP